MIKKKRMGKNERKRQKEEQIQKSELDRTNEKDRISWSIFWWSKSFGDHEDFFCYIIVTYYNK